MWQRETDELAMWMNRERQKQLLGFEPVVVVPLLSWYERDFLNASDLMKLGRFWQQL